MYIFGELSIGTELQVFYNYQDVNADPEGQTTFKWAVADDTLGTNMSTVLEGTFPVYPIAESDAGKYIFVDVRPIAETESGSNSAGTLYGDTVSVFVGPVWNLSVEPVIEEQVTIFPNPVTDVLNIDNLVNINRVELLNILGQPIKIIDINSNNIELDMSSLNSGIYILKLTSNSGITVSKRLIKN